MTEIGPELLRHGPLYLTGTPKARGLEQAGSCDALARPLIGDAICAELQTALGDGLLDASALDFLAAQTDFHSAHGSGIMAEIDGIARGYGIGADDLFTYHHLGLLEVLKTGRATSTDGCSAWAVSAGPDGPLLVKNRDSATLPDRPQSVMMHSGPDICGGAMVCVGTLGSPGAYSSGMNARGFAVADTHVTATGVKVGWLRLFLTTHLLTQCATVAEALSIIVAHPHAGGGTLVLADAEGAVAAVEFGAQGPAIQRESPIWRTNHFTSDTQQSSTTSDLSDAIDANSMERYTYLNRTLFEGDWDVSRAKGLMATHARAPICQHRDPDGADTLSTVIYACRAGALTFSDGAPCNGTWQRFSKDVWLPPLGAAATSGP